MSGKLAIRSLVLLFSLISAIGAPAIARPYRPLVFVPGILGSTLDRNGKTIWGDQQSLLNFSELAVPLKESVAGSVKATGILKSISVLGAFKYHQYDSLYSTLGEIGYVEGVNLFSFPYDWRQSNFISADSLARFIDSEPALAGEFDIIAHSMGGIVVRIYIHQHSSAKRLQTLVNMGVPFQGSLSSLYTLEKGWGRAANSLAGGLSGIREVVLSFPSIYELLPRYRECCIYGVPGSGREFDIFSDDFWQRFASLPDKFKSESGRQFIKDQLANARALKALIEKPLPVGITERSVVGDLRDTISRVYFDQASGAAQEWQQERGDGTVVLVSAANGSLGRTDPSFISHQIIFTDDYVKVLIQRAFDADAGRFRNYAAPVASIRRTNREPIEIQGINIEVDPVLEVGGEGRVAIAVRSRQSLSRGDIDVSVTLSNGTAGVTPVTVVETTPDDPSIKMATFYATFAASSKAGTYQVVTQISGIGVYDDYFLVVPK